MGWDGASWDVQPWIRRLAGAGGKDKNFKGKSLLSELQVQPLCLKLAPC